MSTYSHLDCEYAIDAAFRVAARRFVLADAVFLVLLCLVNFLSAWLLVAVVPLAALYLVRAGLLAGFLWQFRRREIQTIRMFTTVPSCRTHTRRSANLSQHPALHTWYLMTFALGLPAHAYAFVALFVMVALGAFPFVVYAGAVAVVFTSYLHARNSHARFYETCVVDAVGKEFPAAKFSNQYASLRAAAARERMLHDIDLYFLQKEARRIPDGPSLPERSAAASRRGGRSRSAGASGRHNDRHNRQNRKKPHDK